MALPMFLIKIFTGRFVMYRKTYSAKGAVSIGPYSHAVETGELLYL